MTRVGTSDPCQRILMLNSDNNAKSAALGGREIALTDSDGEPHNDQLAVLQDAVV